MVLDLIFELVLQSALPQLRLYRLSALVQKPFLCCRINFLKREVDLSNFGGLPSGGDFANRETPTIERLVQDFTLLIILDMLVQHLTFDLNGARERARPIRGGLLRQFFEVLLGDRHRVGKILGHYLFVHQIFTDLLGPLFRRLENILDGLQSISPFLFPREKRPFAFQSVNGPLRLRPKSRFRFQLQAVSSGWVV